MRLKLIKIEKIIKNYEKIEKKKIKDEKLAFIFSWA